jgi:hypothetical protein
MRPTGGSHRALVAKAETRKSNVAHGAPFRHVPLLTVQNGAI